MSGRRPQRAAGPLAGRRAVAPDRPAVHHDEHDALRRPGRLLEGGPLGDPAGIENDDVGVRAGPQFAAVGEAEPEDSSVEDEESEEK